jgi:hypothetical protein
VSLAAIQGKNRKTPRAFSRACGVAAASAGALFLAWGYLHAGGDPYAYGDPHQPYLDSAVAALALSVPALFFVGLAGLFARGVVGRVGLSVGLVAAVGFVLAFAGATVGVVRGIEGGLGWHDAYIAGRQNTTAFGLLLPAAWIEWTTLLFAGPTVVGLAALGDARVGPSRALPLVMGVSG